MSEEQMSATPDIQFNEELLLQTVRAAPDLARIRELLERPAFDWESFWTLAANQHVQPLDGRVLADPIVSAALPVEARSAIKAARLQTTLNNMSIHAELEAIGALLGQHGIPTVPLKGTHLAQRLFCSLDARRCGDIDILVPERDWDTAHQLLRDFGYQPAATVNPGIERHAFHGVPLMRTSTGRAFVVELHRQLTDPRFVTIDYAALWQRVSRDGNQPAEPARLPAAELLVFLAIHAPKHDTGVLRLLVDIDHLIAREGHLLDWHEVVNLARSWHADAMLYFVLSLAASLLSTPVPKDALRAMRPPHWKRAAVPFLVGPQTILRPPMPMHLRANRFRIAYCLMLRRGGREFRSYWHYIMMPPRLPLENPLANIAQAVRRPLDGLVWTALAIGSATRDRVRVRTIVQP
jgi:hypothetical protein